MVPQALQKGSKIIIVSPAGKIEPEFVYGAVDLLKSWGLKVEISKSALSSFGRYAGTDQERLEDLQNALDRPDIDVILCSRGGYGVIHLIENLSFQKLQEHPKWLIGYSDISILHAAMQQNGVASIHAPMCRHLSEEKEDISALFLKEILFGQKPTYKLESHSLNRKGTTTGILKGGNLSILASLRGTPYDINPENTILFIEDIGEKPYHIERMMYNLKLGRILQNISGLIVGQFTNYPEDSSMYKTVYQTIADVVSEYDYPVCFNFPVGHVEKNYPLICGSEVRLVIEDHSVFLSF